jgi:acyl-CoA synthetase (AMP-forming)/AMP-acid ligase II
MESCLLHELIDVSAQRDPDRAALTYGSASLTYGALREATGRFASALIEMASAARSAWASTSRNASRPSSRRRRRGCRRRIRPAQPAAEGRSGRLHPARLQRRVLVTSADALALIADALRRVPICAASCAIGAADGDPRIPVHAWRQRAVDAARPRTGSSTTDLTAILYTSGSTGKPKGVVLSHRNMVAGAKSVACYLGNRATTRCSRRCRCRSTRASASSRRRSTRARAWCC